MARPPNPPPPQENWLRLANEGLALARAGRFSEAQQPLLRALALKPDYAEGHCHLAGIWQAQQRPLEAERAYRKALALRPDHVDATNFLGTLLQGQGRLTEAEAAYRRAVALAPTHLDAAYNLANLLHDLGHRQEAIERYRAVLRLNADHLDAAHNLALLLKDRGDPGDGGDGDNGNDRNDAEALFRHILSRHPDRVATLNALGVHLSEQGRYAEAQSCFRRALQLQPQSADIHGNLGFMLVTAHRYAEAAPLFRHVLRLRPQDGHAASKLAFIQRHLCAWDGLERIDAHVRALAAAQLPTGIVPFERLCAPGSDAGEQLRIAQRYAEHRHAAQLAMPPATGTILTIGTAATTVPTRTDPRLRIAYLSGDFHEHPVMTQLGGVLAAHDHERFAVYAYSYGPDRQDGQRRKVAAACDHFLDVRELTDARIAARIAADDIDILVDLMGYTKGGRQGITARRPAPLIVNWLGYPGTLGEPRLADYIIGDPVVTPPAHAGHFSEKIACLPHSYLPNDRDRVIGPRPTRRAANLPESAFVFCSFNQSFKFNPETFDIWCRLLREVPDSVLWLQAPPAQAQANLRQEAAARGIPQARLLFAERTPSAEAHLGRLQLADLALDTYPYNSHSTGCDALWAGVPMVTRMGETFASRVGASLLCATNLPELVTDKWDDYFALAKSLALDTARLVGLRARLAQERLAAPLFDTVQFTRDLEDLFLGLHKDAK